MFRRRHHPRWHIRLRSYIWPRIGWRRTGRYCIHRLVRLEGCPQTIALGIACGVAVSFTPFLGFHLVLAMGLAWLMKGSVPAAVLGTIAGNPWTFPFIWLSTYRIGSFFTGAPTLPTQDMTLDFLFSHIAEVFLPMCIGAVPLSVIAWFVTYMLFHRLIAARHQRRRAAIHKGRLNATGKPLP